MHPLHKHVRYNIYNYQEPCRNLILNINLFKQNKNTEICHRIEKGNKNFQKFSFISIDIIIKWKSIFQINCRVQTS